MDDDQWRADGSFRGLAGGTGGKGGGGKKGSGPQFNRVIPKFLQKYHQGPVGPAINAKFASLQPPEEEDGDADALDEVQQAAIDEYLQKDQQKKEAIAKAAGADEEVATSGDNSKPKRQRVAELGTSSSDTAKDATKKRKRTKDAKSLNNKKLLSFSMDDEA